MAKLFVIEENKVFKSVAEASRALGVDASNINKVLKGKRASAGGYHFVGFEQNSDIERARARYEEAIREKTKQKILTKAERKGRQTLIDAVHDRLVDINKRFRNAKKADLYKQDPILQRMMSHTDYFGANKLGGYDTSKSNLRTYTTEELNNLMNMLSQEQGEYAKSLYDNMSRHRNIATYALQFGITVPQAEKYFYIYPVLFELLNVAKQNTEYKASDPVIYAEIYDAIQGEAEPEDLLDFILDLKNVYTGNTSEALDNVLEKWSTKRNEWQERWEEVH